MIGEFHITGCQRDKLWSRAAPHGETDANRMETVVQQLANNIESSVKTKQNLTAEQVLMRKFLIRCSEHTFYLVNFNI